MIQGGMIESKLCAMKGGREKMVSAPGVKANREVGQEPGRSRRVIMFILLFYESTITRCQISVGKNSCLYEWRSLKKRYLYCIYTVSAKDADLCAESKLRCL